MPYTQTGQTLSKPRADQIIQQNEEQLSVRRNFESYWQSLHDYFYIESQDVNKSYSSGNELFSGYLWDSTTLEAADVFASGFMNYLTPPSSKWAKLKHRNPTLEDDKEINDFFQDVMEEVNYALNRSNFYDQMFPSYKSSGVYGTSILLEEEDEEDDIRFTNMPLKQCVILEDAKGRCDRFILTFEYTSNQAASRWGIHQLAEEMQREVREGKGDSKKYPFLLFIGPRYQRDLKKQNKENLPVEAIWVDKEFRKVVEESGYNEYPAFCHRFDKRPFVPWGFSPAMKSLPFARMLNAIAKTNLRTMMKDTDPPIAVPDNAFIAPFNMNPRAINYYDKNAMQNGNDIFAFGNYGNHQVGLGAIDYYATQVKSMMYSDVFLAFTNITKDMNNPEIMERINEKMTILGPAVGRYLDEVISPIIQRTVGILSRRGKLPEPPDQLREDPGYEIDFVGVLAQAQRRAELNSLITGLTMVGNVAQYAPEVLDNLDPDKITTETWDITGAPSKVLRSEDDVRKIREARAEQAAKEEEAQDMMIGAQIAKDASQAEANFKDATETNR